MTEDITDSLLQDELDKSEQGEMLHRKLFDVNIRLYNKNKIYRALVLDTVQYMVKLCDCEFSNYAKLKGISGANVGIPFNIVVVDKMVFLNPKIVTYSSDTKVINSNCGSLRLPSKVNVTRSKSITVAYVDPYDGSQKTERYSGAIGSTLQHEIDHNNGITILDRHE